MRALHTASILEEAVAVALSALGLAAALWLAATAMGHLTADGRASSAASAALARAGAHDLIVVDPALGRGAPDLGRILFPFRPHFAVAQDEQRIDLASFPFSGSLWVGGADPSRWGAGSAALHDDVLVVAGRSGPFGSLLTMVDYAGVHVEVAGLSRPCGRPHVSGGVWCGADSWFYVGPVARTLGGAGTMCLWAHPPRAGALVVPLQLPTTGTPSSLELEVALNFLDEVRQEPERAPVTMELVLEQGAASSASCSNRQGSCRARLALASGAEQRAAVTLSTPDNGRQLICLTGGLRAPQPAAEPR